MKKIMFVTLIAFSMSTAHAAKKIKTISAAKSTNSTSMNYNNNQESAFKFEARPGFGVTAGYFTYGISLESKYGFNVAGDKLFIGLETGFYRASTSNGAGTSYYGNMIPITPSATFELPVSKSVKLYGGVNVGIGISTGGVSYDTTYFGNNANGNSSTSVVFLWKFRPGVVLNDTYVAELPIGTADGSFYFLPNVGVRF